MTNAATGLAAEAAACEALVLDGWRILAQRLRTKAGEIDIVAEKEGVVAFVEVKARLDLTTAAWALGARQRGRLLAAAEIWLGQNPEWGQSGARFDVVLVDAQLRVRRIRDAFRQE